MPVTVKKNKDGSYMVRTPNQVHAKHTTKAKAEAQERLLNAVEHGWTPTGAARTAKKSTKGSPPFTAQELAQGYRRIPMK